MNFYAWIRESVRRAVLLGVSDAMEHLGPPVEGDESTRGVIASLRASTSAALEARTIEPVPVPVAAGGNRKRLGKSLEQIQAPQVR